MVRLTDELLYRWLRILVVAVLIAMPFHAFITVWFSGFVGHYTLLRLWKELALLVMSVGVIVLVCKNPTLRQRLTSHVLLRRLLLLLAGYAAIHVLIGGFALAMQEVTAKALGYSFISNLRFLAFFIVCIVVGSYYKDWFIHYWRRILLWPAALVVALGLLQFFVLPADFLRHFGYNSHTIAPYIAVDQKPEYARVQSSLRGPNPLGAYLLVIITALVGVIAFRLKNIKLWLLLVASALVLFGTYSRSAMLGILLALSLLVWAVATGNIRKWIGVGVPVVIVIAASSIVIFRNNDFVQNVVFHTDETSHSSVSSNEARAGAITGGFKDIVREPLGQGPGTAGPASVYNDNRARISEDYFLQVGQEVGVAGLTLFLAICTTIASLLWQLRSQRLAQILLASFVGLSLVNIFSHAWADDTLAYIWWGFAGLCIGMYVVQHNVSQKKQHAKKAV